MMSRRERILVLTTSYPRRDDDAAGHFVRSEVQQLRDEGHDVTVAAPGGPFIDPGIKTLGASGLFSRPGALPRIREKPWRLWGLLSTTVKVLRLLEAEPRFDRLVCHWLLPTAFPWGFLIARRVPKASAVAHGSDVRVLLRLPAAVRRRILSSLVDVGFEFRFVSEELKAALMSAPLTPGTDAAIERAAVQPAAIECPMVPPKSAARFSLGMRDQDQWAIVVGRLIDSKRPEVALAATDLVPNLKVAVIGDGPLRATLAARYPDVRFLGQLSRHRALTWISAADLLVSASRIEGAPTVIREARSLGTPVVSSLCGDVRLWEKQDADLWVVDDAQTSERRGNS